MPSTSLDRVIDAKDRLIVALDYPSAAAALSLVDSLEGQCRWFKVGLELYLAAGASVVTTLRERGLSVFLDLKLHDIPNTVGAAVRVLSSLGASLLTLHAAGGPAMLAAAADAAAASPESPRLLAVTVLTSMNTAQLNSIGVSGSPADQVLRLARMAAAAGVADLVCSSEELGILRTALGLAPRLVVPGIRPVGSSTDDQQRIASPAAAIAAGASMLVVGRPITKAADPARATEAILNEIGDSVPNS